MIVGLLAWLVGLLLVAGAPPAAEAVAPMTGVGGTRTTAYTESICNTDPNVFFCEDFEDAGTRPTPTANFSSCNSGGGTWGNPALAVSGATCTSAFNGGSFQTNLVTGRIASGNGVWRHPVENGANTTEAFLAFNGVGTPRFAYYVRFQFYLSSNFVFPTDAGGGAGRDQKLLFTHPQMYANLSGTPSANCASGPPSCNFQNGAGFFYDYFCPGPTNFGDVLVMRRAGSGADCGGCSNFPIAPWRNNMTVGGVAGPPAGPGQATDYCTPMAAGTPANNSRSVRFQVNRWYTVEMHFILADPAGTAEMWLDGNLLYRYRAADGQGIRTCVPCSAGMAHFWLTGFRGLSAGGYVGSIDYDNIIFSTAPIGVPTAGGGSPPTPPTHFRIISLGAAVGALLALARRPR